jgi:hypothetical protein
VEDYPYEKSERNLYEGLRNACFDVDCPNFVKLTRKLIENTARAVIDEPTFCKAMSYKKLVQDAQV